MLCYVMWIELATQIVRFKFLLKVYISGFLVSASVK